MPADDILRFNGALPHDPGVDTWFTTRLSAELATLARHWFDRMRHCGDDVLELVHDGCPVAPPASSPSSPTCAPPAAGLSRHWTGR